MNSEHPDDRERLLDRLADRAMDPQPPDAAADLPPSARDDEAALERAAAALAAGCAGAHAEPMPAFLAARIARRGREIVAPRDKWTTGGRSHPERPLDPAPTTAPLRAALGWYVAAMALLLAAALAWPRLGEWIDPTTPARDRETLIATAPDLVRGVWRPTGELEGRNVSGTCIWSDAFQRGFLAFRGLPPNEPEREQYQLWIRVPGLAHPVDGGVFDARAPLGGETDVVVPVDAKLAVAAPTGFAVTIEKRGGVVVSDRTRLVLEASLAR